MNKTITTYYKKSINGIVTTRKVEFKLSEAGVKVTLDGTDEGHLTLSAFNTLLNALKDRKKIDSEVIKAAEKGTTTSLSRHTDNCILRAFGSLEKLLKKADKEKAFKRDNIVFSFEWKKKQYQLSCVPKYALGKDGQEFIVFKNLDCNAIVALKRKQKANKTDVASSDSEIEYIVAGKLSSKAYNAGTKSLQAKELESLTKRILNSYFNGMSWSKALELCKRCKKYSGISLPASLK